MSLCLKDANVAGGGGPRWELVDGDRVARTDSAEGGRRADADIRFVLNSHRGGMLRYHVRTSTTAPHDDFAILLDGKVRDAIFGEMLSFERRSLAIPPGIVRVTMRHRTNPGNFGPEVFADLGEVTTEGSTWLKDLMFEQD